MRSFILYRSPWQSAALVILLKNIWKHDILNSGDRAVNENLGRTSAQFRNPGSPDGSLKLWRSLQGWKRRSSQENKGWSDFAMLSIYFGDMPQAIYNTPTYFNNVYLDSWLEDALNQRMIKAVDKGEVRGPNAVETKALGLIPPTKLSGGVKTLMLIHNLPDKIFNASNCGNNCARWILEIAKKQDVTINLRHIMDFGNRKLKIKVLNNGQVVDNMGDLAEIAARYV